MDSRKDANPATDGLPFGAFERAADKPSGAVIDGARQAPAERPPRRGKDERSRGDDDQGPEREDKHPQRERQEEDRQRERSDGNRTREPRESERPKREDADRDRQPPARSEREDRRRERQPAPRGEREDHRRDREQPAPRAEREGAPPEERSGERAAHEGERGAPSQGDGRPPAGEGDGEGEGGRRRWQKRRRGRRGRRGGGPNGNPQGGEERARGDVQVAERREHEQRREPREQRTDGRYGDQRPPARQGGEVREVEGMVVLEHASHGRLRRFEHGLLPNKNDVHISPRFVQQFQLRDGEIIKGTYGRGQGKNKYDLVEIQSIDGLDPREAKKLPQFKRLTSIDPDFHYAVGDGSRDTSLRIIDLICPIGRGQRGLIVAPPRSGKTILLQKFSHAIEEIYPEVELIVLLVDERPEEATEWKRTVQRGKVFVSTNDELHKNHVELCEAVWMYARHRVELGKDVILLMDSITRMGRAYNNVHGNSGKTMSGGLDTRALERPKQFFGSARNTETAGSLTILGTCLIETGSVMDKIIFEEFKGTGNMELVLSRKLADRRIFPAIDIEKSGTRKEEKLISANRLKQITTLRRVLVRMHFTEAMELLVSKLDDVEKTDDFLKRFTIDPEA